MTKKAKPLYSHSDVEVGKNMTKQSGAMTPAAHWRAFVAGQPLPDARPPVFADISGVDYGATRDLMAEFDSEFQALPAHVRDEFGNDSDNYFDFLEENEKEIAENGFKAVLGDFLSPTEAQDLEKAVQAVESESEGDSPDSAQKGATEDESGT